MTTMDDELVSYDVEQSIQQLQSDANQAIMMKKHGEAIHVSFSLFVLNKEHELFFSYSSIILE